MEKETIGLSVYEQLKEIVLSIVKESKKDIGLIFYFQVMRDEVEFFSDGIGDKDGKLFMSYHDLFSVDSGVMEFVKRDKKLLVEDEIDKRYVRKVINPNKIYERMGPMTAEQKVQYFVNNATLPTIKSE